MVYPSKWLKISPLTASIVRPTASRIRPRRGAKCVELPGKPFKKPSPPLLGLLFHITVSQSRHRRALQITKPDESAPVMPAQNHAILRSRITQYCQCAALNGGASWCKICLYQFNHCRPMA